VHPVEVLDIAAVAVHHEELAAARVLAGVGHGEGAQLVLVGVARRLALDLPAGAAGPGHARGAGLGVGAPALDDEIGDDAVEGQAIVEAGFDELHEVRHSAGRLLREELQVDVALVGLEEHAGHGSPLCVKPPE
jgi:hypothetical protein